MRQNPSRTLAEIDTFDLVLEKRGRQTDITPQQREDTAAYAQSQGYERVARMLRELNARRYGFDGPSLQAVPDDLRRPLKSGTNRPILVAHHGGAALAPDVRDVGAVAWYRIAKAAEHSLLSLPLNQEDAEQIRKLADAARHASKPRPALPEQPPSPVAG